MKITLTQTKKEKPDFTKLGFGKYFTDHMLIMDYKDGAWCEPEIVPYQSFNLDPSTCVLHYGQGIFEGLKAYKNADGKITMFRPYDNFKRMNRSAERLCMPTIDVDKMVEWLKELIMVDEEWIPTAPGTALYIGHGLYKISSTELYDQLRYNSVHREIRGEALYALRHLRQKKYANVLKKCWRHPVPAGNYPQQGR